MNLTHHRPTTSVQRAVGHKTRRCTTFTSRGFGVQPLSHEESLFLTKLQKNYKITALGKHNIHYWHEHFFS